MRFAATTAATAAASVIAPYERTKSLIAIRIRVARGSDWPTLENTRVICGMM